MAHGVQAVLLVVLLALWFQLDPEVRRWEGEAMRRIVGKGSVEPVGDEVVPQPEAHAPASATEPKPSRPNPFEGDSPKRPIVGGKAEFPGAGWYRVKCWRGWFPEQLTECLTTKYRHVANRDEWGDMYWGRWDHEVGAQVAADARMYTTDGIRLAHQPKPTDGPYATH